MKCDEEPRLLTLKNPSNTWSIEEQSTSEVDGTAWRDQSLVNLRNKIIKGLETM